MAAGLYQLIYLCILLSSLGLELCIRCLKCRFCFLATAKLRCTFQRQYASFWRLESSMFGHCSMAALSDVRVVSALWSPNVGFQIIDTITLFSLCKLLVEVSDLCFLYYSLSNCICDSFLLKHLYEILHAHIPAKPEAIYGSTKYGPPEGVD